MQEINERAAQFKQKNDKNVLFPWYDSYWLYSYVMVKNYLAAHRPERLREFVEAFEIFRTRSDFKTCTLEALFSKNEHEQMRQRIQEIQREEYEKYEFFEFGRVIKHDDPFFNELQQSVLGKVSKLAGEELDCSYNFLSLYTNLGVLLPHMDAPVAKWTLDYCIEQSAPWPIHLSKLQPWPEEGDFQSENWANEIKLNPENEFQSYELQEGNALLFSGSSQWHYRERIAQSQGKHFCHLIFFHFVPKGTGEWIHPRNWAKHFGIPELQELVVDL